MGILSIDLLIQVVLLIFNYRSIRTEKLSFISGGFKGWWKVVNPNNVINLRKSVK